MRGLPVLKNIPNLHHQRPSNPQTQPTASIHLRKNSLFMNCQQLIFNTALLPLTIDLRNSPLSEISVVIGFSSITAKHKSEQVSLPWNVHCQKWVQISFGESIGKVEIKTEQNENKISDLHVYASKSSWQKTESNQALTLVEYSIAPQLKLLLKKSGMQARTGREKMKGNTMTIHLKSRTSQRANSCCTKSKLATHRQQDSSMANCYDLQEGADDLKSVLKPCSKTLRLRQSIELKSGKDSLTKGQIRVSTGVKKIIDNKMKMTPSFFEDYIPSKPKGRPRFCQRHVPLSFEEVEQKRGKFQSQWIVKKKIVSTHPFENNETEESEVLQEINRPEVEQSGLNYEDTFEQPKAFESEESGTLYQSRYQ